MAPAWEFLAPIDLPELVTRRRGVPCGRWRPGPPPPQAPAGLERDVGLADDFVKWCKGVVGTIERSVPRTVTGAEDPSAPVVLRFPSPFGVRPVCVPRFSCGLAMLDSGRRCGTSRQRLGGSAGAAAIAARKDGSTHTVPAITAAGDSLRGVAARGAGEDGHEDTPKAGRVASVLRLGTRLGEASRLLAWQVSSGLWTDQLRAGTAGACGILATALAPLAAPGHGAIALASSAAAGPVMVAFCPIDLGCLGDLSVFSKLGVGCAKLNNLSLEDLEKGVLVATFVQGSLGIVRICLGDVFSGLYALLLATLGYNARRPGPASTWLKTYVLITFINGTMSSIDLVQNMLLQNYPLVLLTLPLKVNLAHCVTLLVPGVSFLGAYCGWQHIKRQREVALEAYQQQIMMLMQQPPWPPPPLPFPLPGFPGMQHDGPLPIQVEDAERPSKFSSPRLVAVPEEDEGAEVESPCPRDVDKSD